VSRCFLFAGDFFKFPLTGAASAAGGATSGERRATADQMRATAAGRLVNFFTGFKSSKGVTPAKLFQTSTSLAAGQSAASFASSFSESNVFKLSALAGAPACAAMLLSVSMVNMLFLLPRLLRGGHIDRSERGKLQGKSCAIRPFRLRLRRSPQEIMSRSLPV
jgi:hypothetical protein